jgi:hypothetical protein
VVGVAVRAGDEGLAGRRRLPDGPQGAGAEVPQAQRRVAAGAERQRTAIDLGDRQAADLAGVRRDPAGRDTRSIGG